MKNDKLLPCPFCGGESKVFDMECTTEGPGFIARCRKCFARTYDLRKENAIELWNTRKPMERIVEQLEAAKGTVFIDGKPMYNEDDFIDIDKVIKIVKGGVDNAE